MIADLLSPAPVLILGALLVPFLNGKAKSVYMLLLPAAVWLLVLSLPEGKVCTGELWGYTLVLCRVDKLSMVFGTIFCLMKKWLWSG